MLQFDATIRMKLLRVGWVIGQTSTGLLGINEHRRIYFHRDGSIELEDTADTDKNIIRVPHTIDARWRTTLAILQIDGPDLQHDFTSNRWTQAPGVRKCPKLDRSLTVAERQDAIRTLRV